MTTRLVCLCVMVLLLCGSYLVAAEEPPPTEFAVVQVNGKLGLRDDTAKGKNVYKVTFGAAKKPQLYHLILPDDDTLRKTAKDLVGQPVMVTGQLEIKQVVDFKSREGTPLLVGEIKVKSLKKAEAPNK